MNNTINIYNSPTFCAKPNVKQARRLVDVSVHTLKEGDSKLVSTTEHDLASKVEKSTCQYFKKDKLLHREETVKTPSVKTIVSEDLNKKGEVISHVKLVYKGLNKKARMVENWFIPQK